MTNLAITVNEESYRIDVAPDTPLLWVLRDTLGLTGTKYGCGMRLCGACTVHLDGEARRSCQTPVGSIGAMKITTIEGLSPDRSHPVQRAWIAEQVPQFGYCQSGQIMQAVALLAKTPDPIREQIDEAMDGNICRCATYQRIRCDPARVRIERLMSHRTQFSRLDFLPIDPQVLKRSQSRDKR